MPDGLSPVDAAPLMCAGITTFNALRNSGARPGDVVAVLGLGGLGHLGVQYAAKMGFHTVGIARGKDKEPLARQLGARGLHRQPGAGSRGGAAQAGRRQGHPGDGDQRRGDERRPGRPGRQRHAVDRRGGRVDAGLPAAAAHGQPLGQGLVFRHVDRLAGHAGVQRADRRAVDERDLSAGARRRGLRPHDERQGALPRRADDVKPAER